MFEGSSIQVHRIDHGLMELTFNRKDSSVNVLDQRTMEEWRQVNHLLASDSGVRGVLVTSGKDAFILGADINEFTAIFAVSDEALVERTRDANSILNSFEDLPFPTVVALNGFALGGGLEMALSADARVMAQTARIGLPEIGLGIYPAYGGTVRLTRLLPLAQALDWIIGARMYTAQEALQAGAVHAVAAPELLYAHALALLKQMSEQTLDWRAMRARKQQPISASQEEIEQAIAQFTPKAREAADRRHLPAAQAVLAMIQTACTRDRAGAQSLESSSFPTVAKSAQAAALVQIYLNEQALKKLYKRSADPKQAVQQVAVIGAGIMGGGIAYATAFKGMDVRLRDIAPQQLDLGVGEARRLLDRQVAAGRMTGEQRQAVLDRICAQLDATGFDGVDLAIEAVVENPQVKARVLADLEALLPQEAVIATNTSSLRVSDLARYLQRPQRFAGLHFFNPVPAMPLVEIIRGELTDEATVARATAYVQRLGKTPVVVQDCPGFLVNRVITPYLRAFIRLVSLGADPFAIDRAMVAYGWPMGPAHLEDVVGLDTGARVLEVIASGYADRMPAIERNVLSAMVEAGLLGQKTGAGFYVYVTLPDGRSSRQPNPEMQVVLSSIQADGPKVFEPADIVDALMLPLLLESARCLEERVVATPAELDMALLLGLGYPRYLGGALKQIDQMGWNELIVRCEKYAHWGPEYHLTAGMRAMARQGLAFFG